MSTALAARSLERCAASRGLLDAAWWLSTWARLASSISNVGSTPVSHRSTWWVSAATRIRWASSTSAGQAFWSAHGAPAAAQRTRPRHAACPSSV